MTLWNIADTAIEALHHTVGLWGSGLSQAVLYAQFGTELIECMLTRRHTCARSEQAIGELLAVIGEDVFNFDGASLMQRLQEFARTGRINRWGNARLRTCTAARKVAEPSSPTNTGTDQRVHRLCLWTKHLPPIARAQWGQPLRGACLAHRHLPGWCLERTNTYLNLKPKTGQRRPAV